MHFGIISPPVPGHLHPFGALGRELIERGHQVTILHMADVEAWTKAEGLGFLAIGQTDHPRGSLPESLRQLGQLKGVAALRFTIQAVCKTSRMFCRDAPAAIRDAAIDVLLADQTEPVGCSLAERLELPFVTICNALNLNEEPGVPPPFTDFRYCDAAWARMRNKVGYSTAGFVTSPVSRTIGEYRKLWKLPRHRTASHSFSPLAQISQLAAEFDYPRKGLERTFHYTGPLRKPRPNNTPFPWERLDGRPVVYASLGTLQNARESVFRVFAEACAPLEVQLVIAHGGGLDQSAVESLPGKPLVVSYAPQLEVLNRASLTITHAGLNTVLDSLSCGVPLVAIPITYEQPAIAERVRWSGAGQVVRLKTLSVERLRDAVIAVLKNPAFAQSAQRVKASIASAGGVKGAAEIIEAVTTNKSTLACRQGAH